ncbi:replication endonuclease [Vibrio cincinnatiensis]
MNQFESAILDGAEEIKMAGTAAKVIRMDAFARRFFPRLPAIVRNEVTARIKQRQKRGGIEHSERYARDAVNFGLKHAHFIEDKFPFVDSRKGAKSQRLTHNILMRDDTVKKLAEQQANECSNLIGSDASPEVFKSYLDAITHVYQVCSASIKEIYINPPYVNFKQKNLEQLERCIEIAVLKMQSDEWIEKRLLHLRAQYVEYAQIAMKKVGKLSNQTPVISKLSFNNWKRKQKEAEEFMQSMAVLNNETGDHFDLAEVAKRTTHNPENRRIEMMVRSRGFEELAQDLGYTALFITWTLPSKFHRVSNKWNGASVKEGHKALMHKWAVARAELAKEEIEYFGFRVAEPHKDATSHAHYFLFCSHEYKQTIIDILRERAISEDREELGQDISPRFDVKEADPSKGGATAYIAKYVSKNINGKHMPESESEECAYRARAWASTHRIRQFQQFGGEPVSLWRNLRRAKPEQTNMDAKLEELRQAADSSKWSLFCKLAKNARIEYQEKQNKYGETTKKVIGFSWLGKVIETASEQYSLVKKKDLKRLLESRSGSTWSTENNCNPSLVDALQRVTGWSLEGVQCLINPLSNGVKVPIDKNMSIQLRNGRLNIT